MLHLSDALAAQMLGAAARAFPLECCGLIEGIRAESGWRATALHEAANLAEDPARHFLIDHLHETFAHRRIDDVRRR